MTTRTIIAVDQLYVHGWDKWQSYRSDRGVPPWIKIHRRLLHDPNWASLTDAQKGQLISIWILAADRDGAVPSDPKMVQRLCCLEHEPDLKLLQELHFLDAKLTPRRRQVDANVTHQKQSREDKKEEGASAPFAFIGKIIKLTNSHLTAWVNAFAHLDLKAELIARDAWLAEDPARAKNWFVSTSKYLANRNMEARAKQIGHKPKLYAPLKFKDKCPEPDKPPIEEREAQVARMLKRATSSMKAH